LPPPALLIAQGSWAPVGEVTYFGSIAWSELPTADYLHRSNEALTMMQPMQPAGQLAAVPC